MMGGSIRCVVTYRKRVVFMLHHDISQILDHSYICELTYECIGHTSHYTVVSEECMLVCEERTRHTLADHMIVNHVLYSSSTFS